MKRKQCTGAHHWLLGPAATVVEGTCKRCGAKRTFAPFGEKYVEFGKQSLESEPLALHVYNLRNR